MPNRPKQFASSPNRKRSRIGGTTHLRDRSAAYERLRQRILSDEPLCRYCRAEGRVEAAMVVDHIVALSLGGDNAPDNLCLSSLYQHIGQNIATSAVGSM